MKHKPPVGAHVLYHKDRAIVTEHPSDMPDHVQLRVPFDADHDGFSPIVAPAQIDRCADSPVPYDLDGKGADAPPARPAPPDDGDHL